MIHILKDIFICSVALIMGWLLPFTLAFPLVIIMVVIGHAFTASMIHQTENWNQ